jgi:hypothetical protein
MQVLVDCKLILEHLLSYESPAFAFQETTVQVLSVSEFVALVSLRKCMDSYYFKLEYDRCVLKRSRSFNT